MQTPGPLERATREAIGDLRDAGRSWYHLGAGLGAAELAWQVEHRALDGDAARLCEERFAALFAVIGSVGAAGATLGLHPRGEADAACTLAVSKHRALRVWAAGQSTLPTPDALRLAGEPDTAVVAAVLEQSTSAAVLHRGIATLRSLHDTEDRSSLLTRGVPMGGRDVLWVLRNASVRTTVAWLCAELSVAPRPGEIAELGMDPGFAWRGRDGRSEHEELGAGLVRMDHIEASGPWRREAHRVLDPVCAAGKQVAPAPVHSGG